MYRILGENQMSRELRSQHRHPKYAVPEIEACRPCQVLTWDITRVPGPMKGTYFYLYVMLDLFSRYVVEWMLSANENAEQAQHFINEAIDRNGVEPKSLLTHSDRGRPMTATGTVELLAKLGLSQCFSRPRVSNDNAYSESQFKTLKYHRLFKPSFKIISDGGDSLDNFSNGTTTNTCIAVLVL